MAIAEVGNRDGAHVLSRAVPEDRRRSTTAHGDTKPHREHAVGASLEVAAVASSKPQGPSEPARLWVRQVSSTLAVVECRLFERAGAIAIERDEQVRSFPACRPLSCHLDGKAKRHRPTGDVDGSSEAQVLDRAVVVGCPIFDSARRATRRRGRTWDGDERPIGQPLRELTRVRNVAWPTMEVDERRAAALADDLNLLERRCPR